MRRLIFLLVPLALVVAAVPFLVPPAAPAVAAEPWQPRWPVVAGAYHVHSVRSDGTGTIEEIADAAARAGLQFVILTDHGDATRAPDAPVYLSGVLIIDGVEISTSGGHYVALGLPSAAPYPLAGSPAAVVEDVRRLGGFGFAAHPLSPKEGLRWRDWEVPFDGMEWLNADSEWRDELWAELGTMLLTYPFRPTEVLAGIIDRPVDALRQWDALTRARRVPVLAGADAHARLGYRQETDAREEPVRIAVPGYETSFDVFRNHVILDRPLEHDAARDAAAVLYAIQEGRSYVTVDGLARGARVEFIGTNGGGQVARPGESLDLAGDVALEAHADIVPGATMVVLKDGEPIYDVRGPALRVDVGAMPGVYRLEVRLPGHDRGEPVPWILTNPIYVGKRDAHGSLSTPLAPVAERVGVATAQWRAEGSAGSRSAMSLGSLPDGVQAFDWQYSLQGGPPAGQYAALLFPVDGSLVRLDRLQARLQADRPMRLWVQVRAPGGDHGRRWGRSIYVDPQLREYDLPFSSFTPLDGGGATPDLPSVDTLMLVVDTVNTPPGTAGRILIPDLWLARSAR